MEEKKHNEAFQKLELLFETTHIDNINILKALVSAEEDQLPLFDGSTKRKNVTTPWNDEKQQKFEARQASMSWYSVYQPLMFDPVVIKYIKEVWHFNKKALLVVLDPQGKVVHPNAIHMRWIWGNMASPFTSLKEKELWKETRWTMELLAEERRLNMEQVKTLEKNFELGNKLEPERKMQLARALGLQPRQIAIWFQNRRARWKTKQLEKDYEVLKRQFEAIKADNDALQAQNHKLQAEILSLRSREPTESINLNKETEGSCSNRNENSSDVKLDMSRTPAIEFDSPPLSTHPTSRPLFPPSMRPSGVAQLSQNSSSRPEKIDHIVKEESFTNMFCGIDDQTAFWPWLEQQHFN
ncbi:unnamed protein product [Camellia sinensis]